MQVTINGIGIERDHSLCEKLANLSGLRTIGVPHFLQRRWALLLHIRALNMFYLHCRYIILLKPNPMLTLFPGETIVTYSDGGIVTLNIATAERFAQHTA